jgi:hypothetical protein
VQPEEDEPAGPSAGAGNNNRKDTQKVSCSWLPQLQCNTLRNRLLIAVREPRKTPLVLHDIEFLLGQSRRDKRDPGGRAKLGRKKRNDDDFDEDEEDL